MPTEPKPTAPTSPLDDATRELIRGKARQLVGRGELTAADLGDLEHDITTHVLARLDRFDPAKADRARFVRMLLAHAAATVLRDHKRHTRRTAPSPAAMRRKGRAAEPIDPAVPTTEQLDLALDVAAVLAVLPPKMRQVAEALKMYSVTAAARRLKLSRSAVYRTLAEVRAAFVAVGLGEFVSPARTLRAPAG